MALLVNDFFQILPKFEEEGNYQIYFMTPAITSCKSLKLQENKNKINIPNECKCKKSQQNISNKTQQHINDIIHHDQVRFIP